MYKYLIILLAFGFFACNSNKKSDPDFNSEAEQYFSSIFNHDEPGAAVLVLKNDQEIFSGYYGLSDLQTLEKIDASTLFNLGSISKPFVAYGILILRDEGKLSLDDPISKYFSDFKHPAIADKVQIKHLLTHTSGLPDIRKVQEEFEFYLYAKDAENWAPIMQADELLFEPGEQYEYSNPAFNALALIIEQVSEMKWQDFISERIFKPAAMQSSTITDGAHPESGVAHGYEFKAGAWHELDYGEEPTFPAAGNGGVWSSVKELQLFERAIQQALFINIESKKESRSLQVPENWKSPDSPFIAWSWFVEKTHSGLQTIGHTGTQGGFFCHYVFIPEKQILYLVLANREYPREESFYKILELLEAANWME
jgi:CubicO group peptidase (beta-lactamase class C family)